MNRSKSLMTAVMVGLCCIASAITAQANAPPAVQGYQSVSGSTATREVLDFNLFLSPQDAFANGVIITNREGYSANQATTPAVDPVQNAPPMQVGANSVTLQFVSFDNSCEIPAQQPLAVSQPSTYSQGQEVPAVVYTSTAFAGAV